MGVLSRTTHTGTVASPRATTSRARVAVTATLSNRNGPFTEAGPGRPTGGKGTSARAGNPDTSQRRSNPAPLSSPPNHPAAGREERHRSKSGGREEFPQCAPHSNGEGAATRAAAEAKRATAMRPCSLGPRSRRLGQKSTLPSISSLMAQQAQAEQAKPVGVTAAKPHLPVGGRIKEFKVGWENLTQSKSILTLVTGMRLKFTTKPPLTDQYRLYDSVIGCSDKKCEALAQEIQALITKHALEPSNNAPGFYGRVFLVPKKDGGARPVYNMKALNQFIANFKFKMTTIQSISKSLRQDDWAVSLDLKDAYLHIPIHKLDRKYLKVCFQGKIYQFKAMPFGLSSAPRMFTKLTRVIVLHCRELGIRLYVYLDDSLILGQPRELLLQHRDLVIKLLRDLGFILNLGKSELRPARQWGFLGLLWDTVTMQVALPDDKVADMTRSAQTLLTLAHNPACRTVQAFLGKANFSALAVPRARAHTRGLQAALKAVYKSARDRFKQCPLTPEAREDLAWWARANYVNGRSLRYQQTTTTMATDASSSGWGATCQDMRAAGTWRPEDAKLHINTLETRAVRLALQKWAPQLRGQVVSLQLDNKSAAAYLRREGGTRSKALCQEALQTLALADKWGISLVPTYLPGIANTTADQLSRGKTPDEWCLQPWAAKQIFRAWGKPRVDLFASAQAHLTTNYYSLDK